MPKSPETQEDNVRVAVRIRPLLPKEKLAGEQSCVRITSGNQLVLGKDRAFTFDYLLSSKTTQEDVYSRCVDSLVKSCLEGYNATVFAYGQTGSGKTYTVGGGNITSQTEDEFGVMPRALRHMFERMQENAEREYTIKVSYIELYKEELRDLLDLDTSSKDLHIREDDKGNTLIVGAMEQQCESIDDVMSCLEQGSAYRHTGSTQMNEQSSRSHTIFTIFIEQKWSDIEQTSGRKEKKKSESDELDAPEDIHHYMCAKFHFVDLAGSERANRTGNIGDRFKESVHINSGLLALGNVISALGDPKKKVTHIPYRDSKITRLLKDSLGGNARTLMICCVSPAASNFDESHNALKYANRARNIRNKPIVNLDPQSIRFEEMQTEIKALREELQRQRSSVMGHHTDMSDMKSAIKDVSQISQLEDKIARCQTECSHYRMIAEEAYKQLMDVKDRDVLSQSQNLRLRDWLELMEEIKNKVPNSLSKEAWENQTVARLQKELKQCQNDLKSDEEIFAEKAKELSHLQDRISELEMSASDSNQMLEDMAERHKQQQEQLVAQQLLIEDLEAKLKERDVRISEMEEEEEVENRMLNESTQSSGPPTTTRRAKSVPAHALGNRSARVKELQVPTARNIHTSPALFSLERVMAGFRARSQLLVSHLEDNDDVMQQQFSDDSFTEEDVADLHEKMDKRSAETLNNKTGRSPLLRNTSSRGTYRVSKPKFSTKTSNDSNSGRPKMPEILQTDDEKWSLRNSTEAVKPNNKGNKGSLLRDVHNSKVDANRLRCSTEVQKKKLKQTELEVRQSTQKMRDLSINIRMKEQLIRELIKTGKDASQMNKQYEEKIKALEREKQSAKQELATIQRAYQEMEVREQHDKVEKEKLQSEFRKKMDVAKSRLHGLVKKQKDTERIATITGANEKRIHDLEQAVDKMRQQHDFINRKLKEETERKAKLEREMAKEQQRIKELELRSEQQKKVLKVKTEEISALQRRNRSASHGSRTFTLAPRISNEEHNKLEEQKRWLDNEIDKVLEQRKQIEELGKELEKREDIVAKKEAFMAEKSELEMKKLRSSQMLSKDMLTLTTKLDSVERRIDEKTHEMVITPREQQKSLKDELRMLSQGREKLRKHREILDGKLHEGEILTGQEERRLIEIEEGIEALDAAIEYKNDAIINKQEELRKSALSIQNDGNLMSKLQSLALADTRVLLSHYFDKVITLKELTRKKDLTCSELEMRGDEQDRIIRELEATMERTVMEMDRRLTQQQQEYEKKMQVLMHQLAETEGGTSTPSSVGPAHEAKIQQLEKDLYYYKKTSRELKKKLRELLASSVTPDPDKQHEELDSMGVTPRDMMKSPRTNSFVSRPGTLSGSSGSRGDMPLTISEQLSSRSRHGNGLEHVDHQGSSSEIGSARHRDGEVLSSHRRSDASHTTSHSHKDKLNQIKDAVTPVRISRKDLRRMSNEEVTLRMSASSHHETLPTDSLEVSKNPWT